MSSIESIGHVLTICPQMSSRYYAPLRHDDCQLGRNTTKNVNEKLEVYSVLAKNL